ncbi:MAG TPA: AraC family transcriptional regulator, partial [Ramlibacter sp.]|nr:AraC family transcriptional regulator [Ramlibacter sp.]
MRIAILVLDGAFDTGLAAVMDAFATANELAQLQGVTSLRFDVNLVGVRRRVRTAQGMQVPVAPVEDCAAPDCIVVPAIGAKMPGPLAQALERRDVREAGAALQAWHGGGARVAAACIGTFVLA